jgi:hypothetical protein
MTAGIFRRRSGHVAACREGVEQNAFGLPEADDLWQ